MGKQWRNDGNNILGKQLKKIGIKHGTKCGFAENEVHNGGINHGKMNGNSWEIMKMEIYM